MRKHGRIDVGINHLLHLCGIRPNLGEVDVLAVTALTQRLRLEIEVHGTGEGVGDDQRWTRQVVHLHIGVDATLKVAITRKHRGNSKVVGVDRRRDLLVERTGVSDTGGAAVANGVKTEVFQIRVEAGLLVIVSDDLRTRRQSGLHPGLRLQALLRCVAS